MPDLSKRPLFGRRAFVRLGVAAGGLGMLAACAPAPPPTATAPPAPAKPTEAPKPAVATTQPAPAATQPAPAAAAAPTAASAAGQVTTLKLLGWNYEPPLVQENLDRFVQQNPTYKIDFEPIAGDYLVDLLTRFRAKTPMDVIYVRDQYHASWVESGFLQPLDETPEINALYADMFPYNANQMQWKGKKYGLPYYTDFDVFAYNEKMVTDAGFSAGPATLDELRKQAEAMKQKGISEFPLAIDVSQGSDQMWDYWMYTFASGGHRLDQAGDPTFPDKDKTPQAILEWWVAAANDWKTFNAKANMEVLAQA